MKTFLGSLVILTPLIALVSCGQGGSTKASLKVSKAFAITNPYFGGGMIVAGHNQTTGKSFSQGITSSLDFQTTLEKGRWTIVVMGWDGGSSSPKMFGGDTYCGKITKDLLNDAESIDISVTESDCTDPYFSRAHIDTSNPSDLKIKPISLINTCKSFFVAGVQKTNVISTKYPVPGSGSDGFCEDTGNMPKDLQSNVRAIKIYALNKSLDQGQADLGFSTQCLLTDPIYHSKFYPNMNGYPTNEFRLPMGGIPLAIAIYKDTNCDQPIQNFKFFDGIAGTSTVDKILITRNTYDMKLILPASDLGRAKSPFMHLLPSIKKYNAGSPAPFALTPLLGTNHFRARAGTDNRIRLKGEFVSCDPNPDPLITSVSCQQSGDEIEATFTAAVGTGTITINGSDYTVLIEDETSDLERLRYASQKVALEHMGHTGGDEVSRFFNLHSDHDSEYYGTLADIRNMLSGDGAGGVINVSAANEGTTFELACRNTESDITVSIFKPKEVTWETYRVVLRTVTNNSATKFTCNPSSLDESNCATNG